MKKADYQLRTYHIMASTTSLGGTPVAAYVVVPYSGNIEESFVSVGGIQALTGVCTTTVAVLPAGVAANAVNVGTTLALASGAAVGASASAKHTSPTTVVKGDVIRFTPAGATGAGVVGTYVVKIRR